MRQTQAMPYWLRSTQHRLQGSQAAADAKNERYRDVHLFGVAQPRMPDRRNEAVDYPGFLLRPEEMYRLVERVGGKHMNIHVVVGHGGKDTTGDTTPMGDDQIIGQVEDMLVDRNFNLIAHAVIKGDKPAAKQLLESIKKGTKWGFSNGTHFVKDPATANVTNLTIDHLGLTTLPEYHEENAWVNQYTTDAVAARRLLREHYLTQPGLYATEALRKKLAETEAADRPLYTSHPILDSDITHDDLPSLTQPNNPVLFQSLLHSFNSLMSGAAATQDPAAAQQQQQPPAPVPPEMTAPPATQKALAPPKFVDSATEIAKIKARADEMDLQTNMNHKYNSAKDILAAADLLSGAFSISSAPTVFLESIGRARNVVEMGDQIPLDYIEDLRQAGSISPEVQGFLVNAIKGVDIRPEDLPQARAILQPVYASAHTHHSAKEVEKQHEAERNYLRGETASHKRKYDEVLEENRKLMAHVADLTTKQSAQTPLTLEALRHHTAPAQQAPPVQQAPPPAAAATLNFPFAGMGMGVATAPPVSQPVAAAGTKQREGAFASGAAPSESQEALGGAFQRQVNSYLTTDRFNSMLHGMASGSVKRNASIDGPPGLLPTPILSSSSSNH